MRKNFTFILLSFSYVITSCCCSVKSEKSSLNQSLILDDLRGVEACNLKGVALPLQVDTADNEMDINAILDTTFFHGKMLGKKLSRSNNYLMMLIEAGCRANCTSKEFSKDPESYWMAECVGNTYSVLGSAIIMPGIKSTLVLSKTNGSIERGELLSLLLLNTVEGEIKSSILLYEKDEQAGSLNSYPNHIANGEITVCRVYRNNFEDTVDDIRRQPDLFKLTFGVKLTPDGRIENCGQWVR